MCNINLAVMACWVLLLQNFVRSSSSFRLGPAEVWCHVVQGWLLSASCMCCGPHVQEVSEQGNPYVTPSPRRAIVPALLPPASTPVMMDSNLWQEKTPMTSTSSTMSAPSDLRARLQDAKFPAFVLDCSLCAMMRAVSSCFSRVASCERACLRTCGCSCMCGRLGRLLGVCLAGWRLGGLPLSVFPSVSRRCACRFMRVCVQKCPSFSLCLSLCPLSVCLSRYCVCLSGCLSFSHYV